MSTDKDLGPPAGALGEEARERLADVAGRRAMLFDLLAAGFSEPGPALVDQWRGGGLRDALAQAVAWLGPVADAFDEGLDALDEDARGAAESPDDTVRDLRVEYARLFTGPGHPAVAIHESEYVNDADGRGRGPLHGPAAEAVAEAYREEGLAPAAALREPPDHLATELQFLGRLCRREQEQWREGNADEARRLRRAAFAFLDAHGARWMPAFVESVAAEAGPGFYGALASLLDATLAVEYGGATGRPQGAADAPPPA